MINVAIIGAAGYTGGELIRILLHHPEVNSISAISRSHSGKPIHAVHTDLFGETELCFCEIFNGSADVVFLCMGHGESKKWLTENPVSEKTKLIDLSQDFRSQKDDFVYGLPEFQKEKIKLAQKIANPGCFATAIQLALLPAVKNDLISGEINCSATTGSTGAGQSLSPTSHFTWRNGNHSAYKSLEHQHLAEIAQIFSLLNRDFKNDLNFIPQRGSFTRGIHATIWFETEKIVEEIHSLYKQFYALHPFTHISENEIDLKQVTNTNKCLLHLKKTGNKLVITSVIDNLLKGASGQAVQNMNLLFGFEETSGLKLKPSAY
ncbi:MAG TPA: N-acetyl-gamma-glutamyl-phosphate reductase [Bacteroidia bacterium]|jgi:N-acetyl-gamma-glutamyl-phosphate reductase|nr:N-acetyl-gamma-glutamyl-phosphate reductase [Bacteroidia bacterium]